MIEISIPFFFKINVKPVCDGKIFFPVSSDPAAVPAVVSGDGIFRMSSPDGAVDGVAVVDEKGDAAAIAPVGTDADVIHVAENDDVARLPLRGSSRLHVSTCAWRRR